jgi:hypothetical protein
MTLVDPNHAREGGTLAGGRHAPAACAKNAAWAASKGCEKIGATQGSNDRTFIVVCDGGFRQRTMYLLTLFSLILMPLSNSPWMRRAPQVGFSRHILWLGSRASRRSVGLPGWPRRIFHLQNRLNLPRCQAITSKKPSTDLASRKLFGGFRTESLRYDRPSFLQLESDQIVSVDLRRHAQANFYEASVFVRPIESDNEVVFRVTLLVSRRTLTHEFKELCGCHSFELAVLLPT